MNYAPVDPTIDRTTPDEFGQTVNEGMNHTLGQLADDAAKARGLNAYLNPEFYTEKEWQALQDLAR